MSTAFHRRRKGGLDFGTPGVDPGPVTKHYKKAEFSINSKKNFQSVDVSNNRRGTPEQGVPRSMTRMLVLLHSQGTEREGSATLEA